MSVAGDTAVDHNDGAGYKFVCITVPTGELFREIKMEQEIAHPTGGFLPHIHSQDGRILF